MITDRPPRNKALIEEFHASDRLLTLEVPADDRLRRPAKSIQAALKADRRSELKAACTEFLRRAADFHSVPGIQVLTARPIRVREGRWATELFGDYAPATGMIRNWMRKAVRKEVTSFGTFLSTLCHEFCHHLDFQRYEFTALTTRAASISVQGCSTITPAVLHRSGSTGLRCPADDGVSTGLEPIAADTNRGGTRSASNQR